MVVPQAQWTAPFNAISNAPACPDRGGADGSSEVAPFSSPRYFPAVSQRSPLPLQDCLYLNVFTSQLSSPASAEHNKRGVPVMFWLYGGDLMDGSATVRVCDAPLCERGVSGTVSSLCSASQSYGPVETLIALGASSQHCRPCS